MYNLHSLHGHAVGFQFLIECPKEFRVLQRFISLGTRFQVHGPEESHPTIQKYILQIVFNEECFIRRRNCEEFGCEL